MIQTVAELLGAFLRREAILLENQNIKHAPTIGAMFEGLTQQALEYVLPVSEELNIVSGFIDNGDGKLSKQLDCILAIGEGEQIPYTNNYKYAPSQVIAVIEVKKNLYAEQIADSYENLYSVKEISRSNQSDSDIFVDAYCSTTGELPPDSGHFNDLDFHHRMIYASLVIDSIVPIRIVFGYDGFSSEFKLRDAFVNYIQKSGSSTGLGPASLPNLIVCKNNAIVKCNGMPYSLSNEQNEWMVCGSHSGNPVVLFLELIWTRLSYLGYIEDSAFGIDLVEEVIKPLLWASPGEDLTQPGWNYTYHWLSNKQLKSVPANREYSPNFITEAEASIIHTLDAEGTLRVDDERITAYLQTIDTPLEAVIQKLKVHRLVTVEGDEFKFLTKQCCVCYLPDGRIVAGENVTGRVFRWVENHADLYRKARQVQIKL